MGRERRRAQPRSARLQLGGAHARWRPGGDLTAQGVVCRRDAPRQGRRDLASDGRARARREVAHRDRCGLARAGHLLLGEAALRHAQRAAGIDSVADDASDLLRRTQREHALARRRDDIGRLALFHAARASAWREHAMDLWCWLWRHARGLVSGPTPPRLAHGAHGDRRGGGRPDRLRDRSRREPVGASQTRALSSPSRRCSGWPTSG